MYTYHSADILIQMKCSPEIFIFKRAPRPSWSAVVSRFISASLRGVDTLNRTACAKPPAHSGGLLPWAEPSQATQEQHFYTWICAALSYCSRSISTFRITRLWQHKRPAPPALKWINSVKLWISKSSVFWQHSECRLCSLIPMRPKRALWPKGLSGEQPWQKRGSTVG